jgi:hypoxanthine phosphoribosyltransferase
VNDPRIGEVLIDEGRLQARVGELAAEISADYAGREVLVIGVLKGALPFISDLVRRLTVPCRMDFMAVSSYGSNTQSSGVVRILKDLDAPIAGRHVLVVEDVVDSGLTLSYLMKNLASREPATLELATLMLKPAARRLPIAMRYVGFEMPDTFVVGYGLDYDEQFRQLPYVAALDLERSADAQPGAQAVGHGDR